MHPEKHPRRRDRRRPPFPTMKTNLLLEVILLMVFLLSGLARGADFYQNPILRGVNPDPSICRVGEDYYLITSSMYFYPGVPVYHSQDLVNWELIGHALTTSNQFCLAQNHGNPMMYAATLRYHAGKFYVITTDVNGGGNFFVTATNAAGPWSDPVWVDRPMFDPSLFFDDDGKVYYTRRGDFKDKDIVQAEIDVNTGRLRTPLRGISKGLVSDDTEGPHLYKINGWYYLSMGEGGSRALHMQTIARSKNPYGPFEPDPRNPFIAQHNAWWHPIHATGHADLVDSADGRWWAVYLGTRHAGYDAFSAIGRETFLVPVVWHDNWPVVRPENIYNFTVPAKTLPLHPWPQVPARDEFNETRLGLQYVLLAYPQRELFNLTERPGWLRLKGQAGGLAQTRQVAFVGRRQQEFKSSAAVKMEFSPAGTNEEAGLTVFQTADFHYDIFKTIRHGQTAIVLRKTVGDMSLEAASAPSGTETLWLKIKTTPEGYEFWFAEKEGDWKKLGGGMANLIATEVAGVWSGALLGMYSTGNNEPCKTPAGFDWFEYQPEP